jgi:hypothetical protein
MIVMIEDREVEVAIRNSSLGESPDLVPQIHLNEYTVRSSVSRKLPLRGEHAETRGTETIALEREITELKEKMQTPI